MRASATSSEIWSPKVTQDPKESSLTLTPALPSLRYFIFAVTLARIYASYEDVPENVLWVLSVQVARCALIWVAQPTARKILCSLEAACLAHLRNLSRPSPCNLCQKPGHGPRKSRPGYGCCRPVLQTIRRMLVTNIWSKKSSAHLKRFRQTAAPNILAL